MLVSFAVITPVLLLSACFGNTYAVRYRLTLAVTVDGEVKTGSSVVELTFTDTGPARGFDAIGAWTDGVKGEATTIDLGPRGMLICTFHNDPERTTSPYEIWALLFSSFPAWFHGTVSRPDVGAKGAAEIARLEDNKPRAEIDIARLPMLVRFRDTNDPTTVEHVDPYDLAASFGPDVKLVQATIEITDDPVTMDIKTKLKWLADGYFEKPLIAATARLVNNNPPEHLLTFGDFERN